MKWTFASVGILIFGFFGILIITFFNEVTVSNEQDYYTLKEAVEAAMLEAVDATYYRLTGSVKINQEKFVENFTRRFAQVATYGEGNYNIEFYDISESPPKVSVRITDATNVYNIFGTYGAGSTQINVVNQVSAILDVYESGKIIDVGSLIRDPDEPVYILDDEEYKNPDGEELPPNIEECVEYDDRIECQTTDGEEFILEKVPEEEDEEPTSNPDLEPEPEPTPGEPGEDEDEKLDIIVHGLEYKAFPIRPDIIFYPKEYLYLEYNGANYYSERRIFEIESTTHMRAYDIFQYWYCEQNDSLVECNGKTRSSGAFGVVFQIDLDDCKISNDGNKITCGSEIFTKNSDKLHCCFSVNDHGESNKIWYVVQDKYCNVDGLNIQYDSIGTAPCTFLQVGYGTPTEYYFDINCYNKNYYVKKFAKFDQGITNMCK